MVVVIFRSGNEYWWDLAKWQKTLAEAEVYFCKDEVIFVPKHLEYAIWRGERLIGMVAGEMVACPFKGSGKQLDDAMISRLAQGSSLHEMMSSYEGVGTKLPVKWILVGVVVLVILFVVWKFVLHGQIPGLGGNSTVVTPTPTPVTPLNPNPYSWIVWLASNLV